MGTSNWQNISYCIGLIREVNPQSILDIGTGFGRWGMICREFLEVWNGKVFRKDWKIRIDGIEAFEKNLDEYHQFFYTNIYNGDACQIINNMNFNYDLIILGDVLEHIDKKESEELLKKCINISKSVLINIPVGDDWDQDEIYCNKYEEHRSVWSEEDFSQYNVIRKRKFKDYLYRDYFTYLISDGNILENTFEKPEKILEQLKFMDIENELIDINRESNELIYNNLYNKIYKVIKEEEEKIYRVGDKYMSKISLILNGNKNAKSNGYETWIYNIASNEIKCKDLKNVIKIGNWEVRKDTNSPTGELLLSWTEKSQLNFNITGDTLIIKCLNHPWSGCLTILKDDKFVREIDLYNDKNKIVDFCVNIGG